MPSSRSAKVTRKTQETNISLGLTLDGSGRYEVSTGIGMLDHLLEQLARHGLFDLRVQATGDIDRDPHHLVEDIGIMLGRALDKALGERRGIVRFGHAIVPMDEALAMAVVDLGGRAHAAIDMEFGRELIGQLPAENIGHLLSAFAQEGRFSLHLKLLSGANDHHRAEAAFKALARALSDAVRLDERIAGEIPSTKDVL